MRLTLIWSEINSYRYMREELITDPGMDNTPRCKIDLMKLPLLYWTTDLTTLDFTSDKWMVSRVLTIINKLNITKLERRFSLSNAFFNIIKTLPKMLFLFSSLILLVLLNTYINFFAKTISNKEELEIIKSYCFLIFEKTVIIIYYYLIEKVSLLFAFGFPY